MATFGKQVPNEEWILAAGLEAKKGLIVECFGVLRKMEGVYRGLVHSA